MADDKLRVDPAVDIVGGQGRIRFITPRGGFALRDPQGVALAITNKCRNGDAADEILSACTEDTERAATQELLGFLQARNIVGPETAEDQTGDISKAWLRHYSTSRDTPVPAIEVRGAGQLAQSLNDKLAVAGIPQAINCAPTCIVAAFDTPQLNALRQINLEALNDQVAFLPVWLERSTVRWGPMTLPGATGCLECLLHRRHNNERRADPVETMDLPELSVSPLLCEFGAMLAVGEIQRWAVDAHVDTDLGVAWHFDWLTMQMSGSRVLRLPRCPACGLSRAL